MVASKAQQAATAERRGKAIRMKIDGATYTEIAEALGYHSRGSACTDIRRALEKHVIEEGLAIETWRELELQRFEAEIRDHIRLRNAYWDAAIGGDTKAAEIVDRARNSIRKAVADECKLLGINAPQRLEVLTIDALDVQIQRLEAELGAGALGIPAAAGEAGQAPPAEGPTG
ncbi:hypothetical protein ACIQWN_29045 [Streptomyces vinaceus]|uniref:hypothetical protein n=1 Tax=Streptomyces vinaceus TaxID=1960 RepID=UPI0037FE511C